jgi:hypothetical protein
MQHLELLRWIDLIEKNGTFSPDERAHINECEKCQNLFLALARENRNKPTKRENS